MNSKTLAAAALLALLAAAPAFAGSTTMPVKDGNSTSHNFDITTDASGNYLPWTVLCDGAAAANCAGVNASGQVAIQAPPTLPLPSGAATAANQTATQGGIGAATAPADMTVGGAVYNSGGISLSNGQSAALQADSAGRLIISPTNLTNGFASAFPTSGSAIGADSSGNLVGVIQADNSAAINVSTATTTQLVALSAGKKIYVTSFDVIAGGTGNITFEYGTGTNCGTGTTALTGAYNLTAQNGISKGNGIGPVLVVPAGDALCVLTSAAVQMSGSLSYTQF